MKHIRCSGKDAIVSYSRLQMAIASLRKSIK